MRRMRICHIYFSPVSSLPVVGHLSLFFQVILFCFQLRSSVSLPRHGGRFVKGLILVLNRTSSLYVVHTFVLGHLMDGFKRVSILDVQSVREDMLYSEESYQCALWTLVHVSAISPRSRQLLEKQLGYSLAGVCKEANVSELH